MGMLMAAGGWVLHWLVGNGFRIVTLPAIILMLAHQGGSALEARRAALRAEGAKQCMVDWEASLLKQRLSVAEASASAALAERNASDYQLKEMRVNVEALERELQPYRDAAATADDRCVSDGVRELVRSGKAGAGNGAPRPGAGKPAGPAPRTP